MAAILAGTQSLHAGHVDAAVAQMQDALRVAEAVLRTHHRLATGARHNLALMTAQA